MSDQQKDLLHRPPPRHEAMRFVVAGTLGAALLGLSSLTFAGTTIFLVLASPFLVMSSPILVPAAIILLVITAGFLFSGGCGIGALAAVFWMYRKFGGKSLLGADQLDFTRMRFASNVWDMKERDKEYGHYVQNKAREAPVQNKAREALQA